MIEEHSCKELLAKAHAKFIEMGYSPESAVEALAYLTAFMREGNLNTLATYLREIRDHPELNPEKGNNVRRA